MINSSTYLPSPEIPTNQTLVVLGPAEQIAVIVIYTLIAFVAVGGNVIVVYTVVHFRRMHTATNYFVVNLAASDIMMAALCIPFSYWPVLILGYWPFGSLMCRVIHFFQVFTVLLSAHTLIVISIDRFLAIIFPLRHNLTERSARVIIAVVWGIDLCLSIPVGIVQDLRGAQCQEYWDVLFDGDEVKGARAHEDFGTALLILQYVIPLIVLVITYSGIGLRLWLSKTPGESTTAAEKARKDSMKKIILMMFLISMCFTLCWLPINIRNVIWDSHIESVEPMAMQQRIWFYTHVFAMVHAAFYPTIYFTTNERFREGFFFAFRYLPGVKAELVHLPIFRPNSTFATGSSYSKLNRAGTSTASMARPVSPGPQSPGINDRLSIPMKQLPVIKMFFCVVSCFALLWAPLNLFNLITGAHPVLLHHPSSMPVWISCHVLAMCNSCVNPFIYFTMNERYKNALFKTFSCVHTQPGASTAYYNTQAHTAYKTSRAQKPKNYETSRQAPKEQMEMLLTTTTGNRVITSTKSTDL